MNNLGFPEDEAKRIEKNYHELYKVSDKWVNDKIRQACKDGFITTGFGLRIRTPILKYTPYSEDLNYGAAAEARTAGNALGQGWGVLNDRAMNEVIDRIDNEGYSFDILPLNKIHDACYYLVRDDIDTILWLNQAVTKAARWQEPEAIKHDTVHIHGNLGLFYPSWANEITLPEDCTEETLIQLTSTFREEHQ